MTSNAVSVISITEAERLNVCPLCDGQSFKYLPTPGRWIGGDAFNALQGHIGLAKCRGCGLVFTNPRPVGVLLDAFYSGNQYSCHESAGSASAGAKADYLLNRIAGCLPPNLPRRLLDYGAGGGGFLLHAKSYGWEAQGYEPGRRGLETCRQAGLDVTDRLEALPEHRFSLITLHHVFEHLADPISVLDGLRKLLAPDGRLFIEVPNAASLRARLALPMLTTRLNIDERYRAFPIHLMYYSRATLQRMLERADWLVEKSFTVGLGLDEFRIRPNRRPSRAMRDKLVSGNAKRRWRHAVRDAFLSTGLGENLGVIARPRQGDDAKA